MNTPRLTKPQAAAFLSERLRPGQRPYSPKTIETWCNVKRLPHLKIGRSVSFSESDLVIWIERQKRNLV